MQFSINSREKGDHTVIDIGGEVNLQTSNDISNKFSKLFNKNTQEVIVDLSRVTFMDFSGVAALVEGLKWSKKMGKSFILKNVSANAINSLTLSKLETAFKIVP